MSTVVWTGDAQAVAQVVTCTVGGTIEADDIFNITIGNKTLSVTAGSTTAADVAAAIVAAFNALDSTAYPEFSGITAADNEDGSFTLTADTAGVPFTVTLESTESGGGEADDQTFEQSTTTANSGPNCWDVAENWSGGAVPVDSDDVVLENSSINILYGLAQSAVTLSNLTIKQSFLGTLGLPKWNAGGYYEYRADYLAIGATTITIGEGDGRGSGRLKINTGSAQTALYVNNSGTAAESGLKSVLWKGTHASNTVTVAKGGLDVAPFAGETATIATLKIGYRTNQNSDSDVRCGSGVTLTNITKDGGLAELASNTTSIQHNGGELTLRDGTPTAITVDGGTVYYQTDDTITTLIVGGGGAIDFRCDMRPRTVTNCAVHAGAVIRDPFKTVTWTNGIDVTRCRVKLGGDVDIDLGEHLTVGLSAI